ncbi:hypothetical protein [Actinoplanes sp. RD1]|uniref:hypothetical protein n=1 Tax=Actinoplanes sp. RD1 TaxID=3064538 RepID=UPI002740C508|nr:hypothetical protein [Actinoplanes sp. RD1]
MTEDEDLNRRLDAMTGDPTVTKHLRASLERLRAGAAGAALAEMAEEILEGRTTLREVARSNAYVTEMTKVMTDFGQWNARLSDQEREKLAAEAVEADTPPRPDPTPRRA